MITISELMSTDRGSMGRSKGYKAGGKHEKELKLLRQELACTSKFEWQKAQRIMDNITELLGHAYGPSGSNIAPRACKFCGYYGHTKQYCEERKRFDRIAIEREIERERRRRQFPLEEHKKHDTRSTQEEVFDRLRLPYVFDRFVGATLTDWEEGQGDGMWVIKNGVVARRTVNIADE